LRLFSDEHEVSGLIHHAGLGHLRDHPGQSEALTGVHRNSARASIFHLPSEDQWALALQSTPENNATPINAVLLSTIVEAYHPFPPNRHNGRHNERTKEKTD
jgi:hypothetical protein